MIKYNNPTNYRQQHGVLYTTTAVVYLATMQVQNVLSVTNPIIELKASDSMFGFREINKFVSDFTSFI